MHRMGLRVRQRDVLTREGRLRARYVLAGGVSACIMMASLGGVAASVLSSSIPSSSQQAMQMAALAPAAGPASAASALIIEDGAHDPVAVERLAAAQKRLQRYKRADQTDTVEHASQEYQSLAQAQTEELPATREDVIEIGKGDTLGGILQKKAGLSGAEAYNAVQAMREFYDPRHLKPGQKLMVRYDRDQEQGGYQFASLRMDIDPVKSVSLEKTGAESFSSAMQEKEVKKAVVARRAEIETSLYGSALKADFPRSVVADAIRIYSYDVDFQRDIRRGDSIEALYERYETEDGHVVKSGDVLMARINVGGIIKTAYRYESKDGTSDYYTEDGKSLRKAIMMTPIDGARISSGFGMRKHPVLGYSKMHKGVDFAAPTGTPIFAAGDGVIEKASRFSSYGNYVKIRHTGGMKTAYAHMSRYGKGITPGVRVKQGQIIGYVGTTGRSTGPHLHFEVMVDGVQVNPRNIKAQNGEPLKGAELAAFKEQVRRIESQYKNLTRTMEMASADRIPAVN